MSDAKRPRTIATPSWRDGLCLRGSAGAGRRGLTFVELLLAVTFFGVLMATAGSIIRMSVAAQALSRRGVDPEQQLEAAFTQMARDLDGAERFFASPLTGSDQQISFAQLGPVADEDGRFRVEWLVIRYVLEAQAGGVVLVREERLWRAQGSEPLARRSLVTIASGRWRFGKLVVDHETHQGHLRWEATWPQPHEGEPPMPWPLPRLVQFECAIAATDGRPGRELSRVFRLPDGVWLTVAP